MFMPTPYPRNRLTFQTRLVQQCRLSTTFADDFRTNTSTTKYHKEKARASSCRVRVLPSTQSRSRQPVHVFVPMQTLLTSVNVDVYVVDEIIGVSDVDCEYTTNPNASDGMLETASYHAPPRRSSYRLCEGVRREVHRQDSQFA